MILTIDDFLPAWLWYWVSASKDEYDYREVDRHDGATKYEAQLTQRITDEIRKAYEEKVGLVTENFYCTIVKAEPGYQYPEHVDHVSKSVSSVLYLWPDDGDGTRFTDHADIAWQTNRLVTWLNDGQLHSYGNSKSEDRYTLNLYQLTGTHRLGVK